MNNKDDLISSYLSRIKNRKLKLKKLIMIYQEIFLTKFKNQEINFGHRNSNFYKLVKLIGILNYYLILNNKKLSILYLKLRLINGVMNKVIKCKIL